MLLGGLITAGTITLANFLKSTKIIGERFDKWRNKDIADSAPIEELKQLIEENHKTTQVQLARQEIIGLLALERNHEAKRVYFEDYKANGGNHYIEALLRERHIIE
jgi:hypothetical protein